MMQPTVEILAASESRTGEGAPRPVVTIRVGGRAFTSECRDMQEAAEIARDTSHALARYYERPLTWPY